MAASFSRRFRKLAPSIHVIAWVPSPQLLPSVVENRDELGLSFRLEALRYMVPVYANYNAT